jgi:hypothetical protein
MKESELNNLVSKTLHDFESIETIHPSEDWAINLTHKIGASKKAPITSIPKTGIAVLVFVIVINLSYVLTKLKSTALTQQQKELHLISNELLINEIL